MDENGTKLIMIRKRAYRLAQWHVVGRTDYVWHHFRLGDKYALIVRGRKSSGSGSES